MTTFNGGYGRVGNIATVVCDCDVCGRGALCIEIDSSEGEYGPGVICQECANSMYEESECDTDILKYTEVVISEHHLLRDKEIQWYTHKSVDGLGAVNLQDNVRDWGRNKCVVLVKDASLKVGFVEAFAVVLDECDITIGYHGKSVKFTETDMPSTQEYIATVYIVSFQKPWRYLNTHHHLMQVRNMIDTNRLHQILKIYGHMVEKGIPLYDILHDIS